LLDPQGTNVSPKAVASTVATTVTEVGFCRQLLKEVEEVEETVDTGGNQALYSTPLLTTTILPTLSLENSLMIPAMTMDHTRAVG
jgi:hypothetical protein